MFIDSHTHFDLCIETGETTADQIISGMVENNLYYSVQISIDVKGYQWSLDFARKNRGKGILFTLGIHPSSIADDNSLNILSDFISRVMDSDDSDLLFGIGEMGLDYFRMRQPKKMQIKSFEFQLELARRWNLPAIIHTRDAMEEACEIISIKSPSRGIMHCFSGDSNDARRVIDLGFYISFAGNVTYRKAHKIQDAAAYVPLDRMLLETDAPFLTPVPLRGKRNRPGYVTHTYKFISELRNEKMSVVEDQISENFNNLLNSRGSSKPGE